MKAFEEIITVFRWAGAAGRLPVLAYDVRPRGSRSGRPARAERAGITSELPG